MSGNSICYSAGETVLKGDLVLCDNTRMVVDQIFQAGTQDAEDCVCEDTGGVMFKDAPNAAPEYGLLLIPLEDGVLPSYCELIQRHNGMKP